MRLRFAGSLGLICKISGVVTVVVQCLTQWDLGM